MTTLLEENFPIAALPHAQRIAEHMRHAPGALPLSHLNHGAMFDPSSSAIALSLEEVGRSRSVDETALGVNRNEWTLFRIASPRLALHRT